MRDRPSTRLLRKTSCSFSYRTLVNGGYIMTMSPTAIGIEVVPMLKRFRNGTIPGNRHPKATPMTMAAKIHAVRYRSKKLRRRDVFIVVMVIVIAAQCDPLLFSARGDRGPPEEEREKD